MMTHLETLHRQEFDESRVRDLATLYEQCFDKPVWRGFISDVLEKPNLQALLLHVENEVVGFRLGYDIGVTAWRSWLLGVKLTHRRKGYATMLVQKGNDALRAHGYRQVTANMTAESVLVNGKAGCFLRAKNAREMMYFL
jgi:ribosomal protein S18 acetylase RimI-like enzyme